MDYKDEMRKLIDIVKQQSFTAPLEQTLDNMKTMMNAVKDMSDNDVAAASTVYGSIGLDTSDLSSFTAFADLTASDVQGWVEAAMGADKITEIKAGLDANIAELVTPTVQTKQVG